MTAGRTDYGYTWMRGGSPLQCDAVCSYEEVAVLDRRDNLVGPESVIVERLAEHRDLPVEFLRERG